MTDLHLIVFFFFFEEYLFETKLFSGAKTEAFIGCEEEPKKSSCQTDKLAGVAIKGEVQCDSSPVV